MLLRIAVIEDEPFFQNELKKLLFGWEAKTGNHLNIMTYSSAAGFFMVWPEHIQFDGIFLDILMPNEDGMEVACMIRRQNQDVPLVFVTGLADRVFQGYDVQALHYLIKPPKEKDIDKCMNKILFLARKKGVDCYTIRYDNSWLRIPFQEIIYLESYGHYIDIHTIDKVYRIRKSIVEICDELPSQFIRCFRSCIVNICHVVMIKPKEILLSNNEFVPLSSTYAEEINRQFIKFHNLN